MVFPRAAQYRRPLIAPVKWLALILAVAALAGSASAAFLAALDWATTTRLAHPWLLAGLPLAGWAVAWVYWRIGQPVEAGNNLLIDEIHQQDGVAHDNAC